MGRDPCARVTIANMTSITRSAVLLSLMMTLLGAPPTTQPPWRAKIQEVYGLAPDEVVKHVEPPFISERADFFEAKLPDLAERYPEGPTMIIIQWDGDPELGPGIYGADVRVGSLLLLLTSLKPYEVDVDHDIANKPIRGDWSVRKGADPSKVIPAFVGHVNRALGEKIVVKREEVEEDAIIATGDVPADPNNSILELTLPLEGVRLHAPLRNTGDTATLLDELSAATGYIVIDERADKRQPRLMEWGSGDQTVVPERKRVSPEELDALLRSISEQAGLKFKTEPRKITRWLVSSDQ
jgi:hypothetical protein